MRVMDAHLHLWDPEMLDYEWLEGPLARPFAEGELLEEQLDGVEEEAAIFVQADPVEQQAVDEVRWVESIALAAGVVAIVAGARLDRGEETAAHLDELAAHERVVGVRHLLQGEPDGFATGPGFLAGARLVAERGWTFDACVRAAQLADVTALAAAVPELRIVLDHLGKPVIGTADAPRRPSAEWLRDLSDLARHPQVFCKLSGLPAESGGVWTDAQVEPFLDAALEAFGAERLMWGSDWPVSSVAAAGSGDSGDGDAAGAGASASGASIDAGSVDAGSYLPGSRDLWFRTVADWAASRGLDPDALFWSNALTFYGIR